MKLQRWMTITAFVVSMVQAISMAVVEASVSTAPSQKGLILGECSCRLNVKIFVLGLWHWVRTHQRSFSRNQELPVHRNGQCCSI